MTATPKVSLKDDDDIVSMKDEYIYGKQIFKYNTGQAINDKKLVDYQIISIYAENKRIEQDIKKNKLVSFKKEFTDEEANYLGSIIIILNKIHDGSCNHMITYHNNIVRAQKFAEYLIKLNGLLYPGKDIFVDSLDGAVSMSKRKKVIDKYVKAVLKNYNKLQPVINDLVKDINKFVVFGYQFIRLYLLDKFNSKKDFPTINKQFILDVLKTITSSETKRGKTNKVDKIKNKSVKDDIKLFYDNTFSKLVTEKLSYTNKTHIL